MVKDMLYGRLASLSNFVLVIAHKVRQSLLIHGGVHGKRVSAVEILLKDM